MEYLLDRLWDGALGGDQQLQLGKDWIQMTDCGLSFASGTNVPRISHLTPLLQGTSPIQV